MKKGSLTIYDPFVSFSISRTNVVVKKEDFTKKTDVRMFDTLYGMYPCNATIPLVEKALEEDKNLLVALCDCDHSTDKYPRENERYWADDFCNYIARDYGNEVMITHWSNGFDNGLPIMVYESTKCRNKKLAKKVESYRRF